MEMPDGSEHPFHGTYEQIVRPNRLVYAECYDMPQFGRPEWQTTVVFQPADFGIVLTHTIRHRSQEARDAHLAAGMQEGEAQSLRRLDAVLDLAQGLTPIFSGAKEAL